MAKHKKDGYAATEGGSGSTKRPTSAGHTAKMAHHALHERTQHGHDPMAHESHGHLHSHVHGHKMIGGHGEGDHHKGIHGYGGLTTPPDAYEHGGKDGEGGEGMGDNCHCSD
jgi:hypothetical protein